MDTNNRPTKTHGAVHEGQKLPRDGGQPQIDTGHDLRGQIPVDDSVLPLLFHELLSAFAIFLNPLNTYPTYWLWTRPRVHWRDAPDYGSIYPRSDTLTALYSSDSLLACAMMLHSCPNSWADLHRCPDGPSNIAH